MAMLYVLTVFLRNRACPGLCDSLFLIIQLGCNYASIVLKEIVELGVPVVEFGVYYDIFPVLKPNGTARLIMNLDHFYLRVKYILF